MYEYHVRALWDKDPTIHPVYFINDDQFGWDKARVLMVYREVDTELKDPNKVIGAARGNVGGPMGAESTGMNLDVANQRVLCCQERSITLSFNVR